MKVTKMLTISTAHVSPHTYKMLEKDADINRFPFLGIYKKGEFGLFIYLSLELAEWEAIKANTANVPEDLQKLIDFALNAQCALLCLDCDGEFVQEIPIYAWEEKPQWSLKCPLCGATFRGSIEHNTLGWHSSCPSCAGSFDVDLEQLSRMTLEHFPVRVQWAYCGEGYNGDYDPEDPNDEPLLRFDVSFFSEDMQDYVQEESACTHFSVFASEDTRKAGLQVILDCFYEEIMDPGGADVRMIRDALTYIGVSEMETIAKNLVQSRRIQRIAYERYQLHWMAEHGYSIRDISEIAYTWKEMCEDVNEDPSLQEMLEAHGFKGGEIYPCYPEFLTSEYCDVEFMQKLLSDEEYLCYLEDIRE